MDYLRWLILLGIIYYLLINQSYSILILFLGILFYLYREEVLPKPSWTLPPAQNRKEFDFPKLEKLLEEKSSLEQYYRRYPDQKTKHQINLLIKEIQKVIDGIYFAFPYHMHERLDNHFYYQYGITN